MGVRVQEGVVDCADPARPAEVWARVLECRWAALDEGNEFCLVVDTSSAWTSRLRAALDAAP